MSGEQTGPDDCGLCGRSIVEPAVTTKDGRTFCSRGCREVDDTFGARSEIGTGDTLDNAGVNQEADWMGDDTSTGEPTPRSEGIVRTFFRVDGMSRAIDEAFLERVATNLDGVADAEASYVTETIAVDHDPETVSASDLREALSTLGYTAYRRDTAEGEGGATDGTRRSREMVGDRQRSVQDMLSTRYVVGIVFGSFMLLPYVVFLYPAYLAPFLGGEFAQLYGGAFENGGIAPILPLFGVLTGIVLVFTGMRVLRGGYVSLLLRRPTTDLLVSITIVGAYGYSVLATAVGRSEIYFDLTVVVAAGVMGVAFYEALVKRRALDRLTDLTVSQVTTARLYDDDETTAEVPVEDLSRGDRILVREGERIPVDGTLVEGACTVDEALVTGESLPILKEAGDPVLGGSLVTGDAAIVKAGGGGSTIDRLTTTLWSIQSGDHGVQRRADRLAELVLPVVVGASLLAGGVALAIGSSPIAALLVTLLALVVVCPWTLGIATPLSAATSIAAALRRGIVVFDDSVFERLRDVDIVVFDKTGTLTTGTMDVLEADAPGDLLAAAGALERRASHPAADAIVRAFGPDSDSSGAGDSSIRADGGSPDSHEPHGGSSVRDFQTHARGVEGTVDGASVLVGHPSLFEDRSWAVDENLKRRVGSAREAGHLPVLVGRNGRAEGIVVLGDEPRDGWETPIATLQERGVTVVVLTGDDPTAAERFAQDPGVDHVFAGIAPEGKTATIRRLQSRGEVAMVGDGTNDAPALATADLGIALGTGTALAADAADIAIAESDLDLVTTAFDLAAAAGRRVAQNVGLAFVYNAITIPLAVTGVVNPLFVMGGVVASSGLITANSFLDVGG